MKIDEKLDKMKSEMRKVLEQWSSYSKEEAIKLLEEAGLSNESAVKLLEAFGDMERAKKTAENVWNTAWKSSNAVGIDYSTDIEKSSNTEIRMTQYFESVYSRCAFLMALKTIEPNEINDELLDKLYEEKISENEITNPVLKTTYHYYSESKAKDAEVTRVKRVQENEKELYEFRLQLIGENYNKLNEDYMALYNKHNDLQTKYNEKEKSYKNALSQIETLKAKLMELQNKGIFKTIADKLKDVFRKKTKELPEVASESHDNLDNNDEKNNFRKSLEVSDKSIESKKDINQQTLEPKQTDKDEWNR